MNTNRLVEKFLATTQQPLHAYDDASARNKELFHTNGKALLRQIAKDLGYATGSYDIRSNKAGIAVCGEVTLHTDNLYIQLSQGCGAGLEILYRTCTDRKDYRGGRNNWLAFNDLREYQAALTKFNTILSKMQNTTI